MSTAIDRGVFKGEAQGARALPPIHRVNMYFFFYARNSELNYYEEKLFKNLIN